MRGQDRPSGQNLESCLRRALLKAAIGEMERRGDILKLHLFNIFQSILIPEV